MRLKNKNYIYVIVQLLLFVTYAFNIKLIKVDIPKIISFISLVLVILGVLIILTAFIQLNSNLSPYPSPKSNTKLITQGVYKFIRHPIYTGIILTSIGYGIFDASLFKVIIGILLYVLFFFKSLYEEQQLKAKFSDYELYQTKSGRFLPKI